MPAVRARSSRLVSGAVVGLVLGCGGVATVLGGTDTMISLPPAVLESTRSLERALARRRSVRELAATRLSLAEAGQLLWAAQGITHPDGLRTAPSAGALYPLECYLMAGSVDGLEPGLYHYRPQGHGLEKVRDGDRRRALAGAALDQRWVQEAPAVVVIGAIVARTTGKYGERGVRYVHIEVGHAGQNVLLQATALGLGAVVVGAFRDDAVREVLGLPADVQPLSLIPVGKP